MRFDLPSPCAECPFRCDITPFLRLERTEEISVAVEHQTFRCHMVAKAPQPRDKGRYAKKIHQHCAGVLIIMAKMDWWGDMQQIAERLGIFHPSKLDMKAPVYASLKDWIDAHRR